MDSKKNNIDLLNNALSELVLKVEQLQLRLDVLCKETGACKQIKKINKELLNKKEKRNGIDINTLREEE